MLIRSQNKEILSVLKNLVVVRKGEKYLKIVNYIGDNYIPIGEYSTEEKAIKVLNMIQNAYFIMEYSKFRGSTKEDFSNPIFEMPKDEEVK